METKVTLNFGAKPKDLRRMSKVLRTVPDKSSDSELNRAIKYSADLLSEIANELNGA
jgi:hypothetical protein